ncbi:hypothetical protein [Paenibacillus sp. FSL H8-0283]|uniref:hypothetical protein n=1 Tax=Paenibacillus sp. FSL H8-0283 TaxID=2921383 RepID=UPI00324448EB
MNEPNAPTTPKNSTKSNTKPEKNETPNEVNTWKPSPSKKKAKVNGKSMRNRLNHPNRRNQR